MKKNRNLIILAVVVACIVAVCVIWEIHDHKKDSSREPDPVVIETTTEKSTDDEPESVEVNDSNDDDGFSELIPLD